MEYDGMRQPFMHMPILPEKEGYIIDFDDESGWPYYISIAAFEARKRMYEQFMAPFRAQLQGEPRKGIIEIISTSADVNGSDEDFVKLWRDANNL